MTIEQAEALAMICHYAKEHLKDNKTMSQSVDITQDIVKKELKEHEQYKAMEEELGIDLLTLFKALKNGIWVKTKNGISQHFTVSIRKWLQTNTYCLYYRPYTHIWFEDYGKTWALTKEELL